MAEILRGAKVKIFPTKEQAQLLDLWRRRCISLWNLLLGMEQAAYDGSKFQPELGWRGIWADVVWDNYRTARLKWLKGYTIRVGKRKGTVIPPMDGPAPEEPSIRHHFEIKGHWIDGQPPKIFLWDDELLKVMARLKQVELSSWIAEIPSHACQAICYDITDAIRAMIRERKKGEAGQGTGFPRFKKQGYSLGSVYLANTQLKFDWQGSVKISNKVGEVRCGPVGKIPAGAKLGDSRIWREGEQWWLSAQFRFEGPEPLPERDTECGVKVAAAAIYTIFDGDDFRQIMSRRPSPRDEALLSIKGWRATRKERRSQGWYDAQSVLAKEHAYRRNVRADVIHKGSRAIVNEFGRISIDKMDVKSMMKKDGSKGKKNVRKAMANAAMYDAVNKVKYKAEETGSVVKQTHVLFPSTQICASCGKIHHNMASGKRLLRCECGHKLPRQKNAAINIASAGGKKAAE